MKRKEAAFKKEKLDANKELESCYQKKLLETERKFKSETQAFAKKLITAERNISTKLKLLQAPK